MCIWYLSVDVEAAIVVAFDEKPQHCFAGNDPHPGCLLAPLQSTAFAFEKSKRPRGISGAGGFNKFSCWVEFSL